MINIKKDDVLWYFYCKSFEIDGKEIKRPNNLCPYFWGAVDGFLSYVARELSLLKVWLIGSVLIGGFFGVLRYMPRDIKGTVFNFAVVFFLIFSLLFFLLALCLSFLRLLLYIDKRLEAVPSGTRAALFFGALLAIMSVAFFSSGLYLDFMKLFHDTLKFLEYIFFAWLLVVISAVVFLLIPSKPRDRIKNFFHQVGAYLKAIKENICPPVNPPEDFQVKSNQV